MLAAVLLGGLVREVAGFGYAVTRPALLAVGLDPAVAVTVMILPTLVANVPLLAELDRDGLVSWARRFWTFMAAAVIETLPDMAVLGRVPRPALALGLGVVTPYERKPRLS